jgi:hypothetical protein
MLTVLAMITLPVELLMHGAFARDYYYLNVNNLRLVALTAVKMGAQYLPTDPPAAIRVADAYAQHHGIAPTEIVLTELSPDRSVLTIRLERKIPQYLAVLAMGGLPARDINVTASAWRQRSVGHPFGTRIIDASARWCSASTIFADRIDSRFLLPERSRLPHVNCYPAAELRGGGGDGEATEHGDTQGAEGCGRESVPIGD